MVFDARTASRVCCMLVAAADAEALGRTDRHIESMTKQSLDLIQDLLDDQPTTRAVAAKTLLALGESAMPCLIGMLEMAEYQQAWPVIIQIIQEIGSPINSTAIPALMRCLQDSHKPHYSLAYSTLLQMDQWHVVYSAHDILTYWWSDESWVQGVCNLLAEPPIDSSRLEMLLPSLFHLLRIGSDENCLDESALGPLCKIGSPQADPALPLLAEKIASQRVEEVRLAVIEALLSFSAQAAMTTVPALQAALSDPSAPIRTATQRVLNWLQKSDERMREG